jgi:hypothetical protein
LGKSLKKGVNTSVWLFSDYQIYGSICSVISEKIKIKYFI